MYSKVKTLFCILCSFYDIQRCVFYVCAFDLCVLEHLKSQLFIHDSERNFYYQVLAHYKKTLITQ